MPTRKLPNVAVSADPATASDLPVGGLLERRPRAPAITGATSSHERHVAAHLPDTASTTPTSATSAPDHPRHRERFRRHRAEPAAIDEHRTGHLPADDADREQGHPDQADHQRLGQHEQRRRRCRPPDTTTGSRRRGRRRDRADASPAAPRANSSRDRQQHEPRPERDDRGDEPVAQSRAAELSVDARLQRDQRCRRRSAGDRRARPGRDAGARRGRTSRATLSRR